MPGSTTIAERPESRRAIVPRPEEAAVPARASELLAKLSGRYGMVGCISGRRAEEARRLVGVEGIAYAGNHGLELLSPGAPRGALERRHDDCCFRTRR